MTGKKITDFPVAESLGTTNRVLGVVDGVTKQIDTELIGGDTDGCVRYDEMQTLTDEQKAQARSNIGASSGLDPEAEVGSAMVKTVDGWVAQDGYGYSEVANKMTVTAPTNHYGSETPVSLYSDFAADCHFYKFDAPYLSNVGVTVTKCNDSAAVQDEVIYQGTHRVDSLSGFSVQFTDDDGGSWNVSHISNGLMSVNVSKSPASGEYFKLELTVDDSGSVTKYNPLAPGFIPTMRNMHNDAGFLAPDKPSGGDGTYTLKADVYQGMVYSYWVKDEQ